MFQLLCQRSFGRHSDLKTLVLEVNPNTAKFTYNSIKKLKIHIITFRSTDQFFQADRNENIANSNFTLEPTNVRIKLEV